MKLLKELKEIGNFICEYFLRLFFLGIIFFTVTMYYLSPVKYTDCVVGKEEKLWSNGYSKYIYYEAWGIQFKRKITIEDRYSMKSKVVAGKYKHIVCYPAFFPFTSRFDWELYDNPDKRKKIEKRRMQFWNRDFSGTVRTDTRDFNDSL